MIGWLGNIGRGLGDAVKKAPGALNKLEGITHPDLGPGGTGGFAGNQGLPKLSRFGGSDGDAMGRRVARELGDATQSNTGVRNSAEWTPPQSGAIQRPVGGMEPPSRLQPVFSREQIRQAGAPVESASDYDAPPTAVMPRPVMKPEMFTGMSGDKPATRSFNPLEPIAPTPGTPRMPQVQATEPTPLLRGEPSLVSPDAPPMMDRTPGAQPPRMDTNRRGVPIPAMPNRGTEPTPYTDYDAARYDSIMSHEKPGGGFKRSAKSILQNALLGAGRGFAANPQGGIGSLVGGALGGGLGATFNPQSGYEQTFDAGPGRQIEQRQERSDKLSAQQAASEKARLANEHTAAQTEAIKAGRARDKFIPVAGGGLYDTENGYFVRDPNENVPKPLPPHWTAVTGPDGKARMVDLNAPESKGQQYSPYVKPNPNGDRPLNVSPGGAVYDPITGKELYRNPARGGASGTTRTGGGTGIPVEARQAFTRANSLKDKANALFTRAKSAPEASRAALEQQAAAAMEDANRAYRDLGQAYDQYFEAGEGQGGWWYGKPKVNASGGNQPTRATVSRAAAEGYAKEKGVSLDEAIQRFAAKGVQVK